jgi:hypothetical protein
MSALTVRALIACVVAAAIVGCASPGGSAAPSSSQAGSSTNSASASASAPATAGSSVASPSTGAGDGALCAKEFEPCPIAAGTYTTDAFTDPFTFTIEGEDWSNDRNWPHGGSMTKAGANSFLWASGVVSGKVGQETVPIGPTPSDFIAHLGKFDGFTVSEPIPVTVDGVSGSQVDVLSNDVSAGGMFLLPEDAFNLSPGEKTRFLVLDKDGATIILFVESYDAATFDTFMAETGQPLLDDLAWR